MRLLRNLLVGVILCMLIFNGLKYVIRPYHLTHNFIHSSDYKAKVDGLLLKEISDSTYLFVGNSLTKGYDLSVFQSDAVNWSISGDVLDGLSWRLSGLNEATPMKMILNLGINDIIHGFGFKIEKMSNFIQEFKTYSPDTQILVMSLSPECLDSGLFTSPKRISLEIINANRELKEMCSRLDVYYVDVYSALQDKGKLRPGFTTDGLHLNQAGYNVWTESLTKAFTQAL
jgi:lysophospholipase L1-like esterase